MLPEIGIIIALYVITRMAQALREEARAVRWLAALTIAVTLLLTLDLAVQGFEWVWKGQAGIVESQVVHPTRSIHVNQSLPIDRR